MSCGSQLLEGVKGTLLGLPDISVISDAVLYTKKNSEEGKMKNKKLEKKRMSETGTGCIAAQNGKLVMWSVMKLCEGQLEFRAFGKMRPDEK